MKNMKINVYNDNKTDWEEYTIEEFKESFKFVTMPVLQFIREIFLHNVGKDTWMEIIFKNGNSAIYNSVFGTYVKQ